MGWLYGFDDSEVLEFPGLVTKVVPHGSMEVTEKPVEGGAALTDHTVLKPLRVTATVFVSPVETRPGLASTVKAATELIERIQAARTVNTVGVAGDVGPWEELLLTEWQVVREFKEGNGGEFELEFTRIVFARAVTNAPIPRRPRDRARINRGPQATAETPRQSLAFATYNRLFGEGLISTNNR